MHVNSLEKVNFLHRGTGWLIHAFTASGACIGLLALFAIHQHEWLLALWLMGIAIVIDAVDGMFARAISIKQVVPEIDGALLDNIVDFVNYTIVPCFFLLVTDLLPESGRWFCVMVITFCSTYQFTQVDAKTSDHFFKGFPSYWNIVVFYLFFWQTSQLTNMIVLLALAFLSFVPIKYVYPSRLDYLTNNKYLRIGMISITILWGVATAGLLWLYPLSHPVLVAISVGYALFYFGISLYRTWVPLGMAALGLEVGR
ncbi:MAG TPA: CDP-alcohol phosphatidyltransferase family protein [Gammaproteobacteria bacterium]|jgi:phosphatidylcholine synthase|nr:CDP-alcohol phosphatidyltransferase family protein [Gammaproteobacteria bacterium]